MQDRRQVRFGGIVAVLALVPVWASAASPQHAVPASASHKATLEAYRSGCAWIAETMPDPAWRPFLKPLDRACEAVGTSGTLNRPGTDTDVARAAATYVRTVARVTERLDAIYMAAWRKQLDNQKTSFETVALNDTGVFLAFQVSGAFRQARTVLELHGHDPAQTATADAVE